MKFLHRIICLCTLTTSLFSCSSYCSYIKGHPEYPRNSIINGIEISVGEKIKVFDYSQGIFFGGIKWWLASRDTSIAKVIITEDGNFIEAYLTGMRKGKTEIYYTNKLGPENDFVFFNKHYSWFTVSVK